MAMKTVCISTYCDWASYGSVMQAIGLKKTLLGLGYESFIVCDRPAPAPEKSFAFQWRRNPRMLAKEFLSIPYRREREQIIHLLSRRMAVTALDLNSTGYNLKCNHSNEDRRIGRVEFLRKCEKNGFVAAISHYKLKSHRMFLVKYRSKKALGKTQG